MSEESLHNWVSLLLQEDGVNSEDINMRKYTMKLIEFLDLIKKKPDSQVFNSEMKAISYNGKRQYVQTLRK